MNTTQTIAWLICLMAAFFAAIVAVRNSYAIALLQRDLAAGQAQQELLTEIRDVLRQIEAGMDEGLPTPAHVAPEQTPAPAE
jgi:hypothetical protein